MTRAQVAAEKPTYRSPSLQVLAIQNDSGTGFRTSSRKGDHVSACTWRRSAGAPFDGYAFTVTVTTGFITVKRGAGALNTKINFIEIGPVGSSVDAATLARVQAAATQATHDTAKSKAKTPPTVRRNIFGSDYPDYIASYTIAKPRKAAKRFYVADNSLYTASAVTDAAGSVVSRYSYDAYGRQTFRNPAGAIVSSDPASLRRGLTGFRTDAESNWMYARARMYSAKLGRFVSRDPKNPSPVSDLPRGAFRHRGGVVLPDEGVDYSTEFSYNPSETRIYSSEDGNRYQTGFLMNRVDPTGMIDIQVTPTSGPTVVVHPDDPLHPITLPPRNVRPTLPKWIMDDVGNILDNVNNFTSGPVLDKTKCVLSGISVSRGNTSQGLTSIVSKQECDCYGRTSNCCEKYSTTPSHQVGITKFRYWPAGQSNLNPIIVSVDSIICFDCEKWRP